MINNSISIISLLIAFYCSATFLVPTNEQGLIVYKADLISGNSNCVSIYKGADVSSTITYKPGKFREDDDWGTNMWTKTTIVKGDSFFAYRYGVDISGKKYKDKSSATIVYVNDSLYDVEYTNDIMAIAGCLCKRAIIKRKDGNNLNVYVNQAINTDNRLFHYKVKGLPMQFEVELEDSVKFLFTAIFVDLKSPVQDNAFILKD